MLYATTRNSTDVFTAHRVLTLRRGPDGGLFVPYRIPRFSAEEIQAFGTRSFNGNLAVLLNLQFGCGLNPYDIDLAIGRSSVRLQQLGQKLLVGECWHNTQWQFRRMVQDLSVLILGEKNSQLQTGGWAEVGVRISVLFGLFGELIRAGLAGPEKPVDIALVSGDFSGPMSAWYARTMGLPIGNIICCCNENASIWDFICHGQLRTDSVAEKTGIPEADIAVPEGLERLISVYGGPEETARYVEHLHQGRTYYAEDGLLKRLRQGIYVTVSSGKRIRDTVQGAWSTHQYLMAPASALVYGGLQDYRARTGERRTALILTEKSPSCDPDSTANALGVPVEVLKQFMK